MAVELHGRLLRRNVPARSRCGRFALVHGIVAVRHLWCSADPCQFANDGQCDVPRSCFAGDYIDCGRAGPVVSGTLPEAIGSLACRSKITSVCARRRALSRPCPRPSLRSIDVRREVLIAHAQLSLQMAPVPDAG
jgi:hypothetical protein